MSKLSGRLELILDMAPETREGTVADVGTDHALVPICLVRRGKAARALAMDVRPGPLERAGEHIRRNGLEERVETRLSDGLQELKPGEAEGVVITGMGGELMLRILRQGSHVRDSIRWWVLSPQSQLWEFRHGLEGLSLAIQEERMLEEDGKFYTVMLVGPGRMHYGKEFQYRYGARLIENRPAVFKAFLEREERQRREILRKLPAQTGVEARLRRAKILEELKEIEEAYAAMR